MLNRKFLTRLLNDSYRASVIAKNSKTVNDTGLKLRAYATYVVDRHCRDRNEDYKDIKQASYGFCPFDVLMWVSQDGSIKKSLFEFNTVNHFLVEGKHEKAVEAVMCILSELVRENKRDIACFDIDRAEAESKRLQEDYEKTLSEVRETVKNEISKKAAAQEAVN